MRHGVVTLFHDPRPRPRPIQTAIVAAVLDHLRIHHRMVVEAATGLGKSLIMGMLAEHFKRVLVIDPQVNLVHQIARSMEKWLLKDVGIEQSDRWADPDQHCVVGSLQTLTIGDRGRRFTPDLVMVDEAHWGLGEKTRELLEYYSAMGAKIVGLTATPHARPDGTSILDYYGRCPIQYGVAPAIDHGWLTPLRGRRVVLKGVDYGDIRHGMADFDGKSAGEILRQERPLHEQVGMVVQNHSRPAAVFCSSIPHATDFRHMLERYGVRASLVHSKMPPSEKAAEMKAFESGEVDMVVNVATLVAGWDSLRVAELHILRPTFSIQRYTQICGRALRPSADAAVDSQPTDYLRKLAISRSSKPYAMIVDYTDTHRYHKLCSSIDVVATTPRVKKYREKLLAAAEEGEIKLDEIDAMAAAEEKMEAERARAEQEAERHRRRQLVVGVTFDATSSDPFAKPTAETPKRREARMLWGPFKGEPIRLIPRKELERIVRGMKRTPGNEWLVKAIKRELEKGLSHG